MNETFRPDLGTVTKSDTKDQMIHSGEQPLMNLHAKYVQHTKLKNLNPIENILNNYF